MTNVSARGAAGAVAVTAALALAACSGSSSSTPGSEPAGSSSQGTDGGSASTGTAGGSSPYLPVPDGVVLTDEGSELGLGEAAVVAWRPRQGQVGVLKLTVRRLVHADIKDLEDWQLDAAGRASSLYYVTVSVENAGDQDLSGRPIPLYVLDGGNTLVEANTFKTTFEKCPSKPLPQGFGPGEKIRTCLTYLVPRHGKLVSASFRPTEKFNPITWVGKVTEPQQPKKKKKK